MRLADGAHDRQPEAGAFGVRLAGDPLERLREASGVGGVDGRPGVLHAQLDAVQALRDDVLELDGVVADETSPVLPSDDGEAAEFIASIAPERSEVCIWPSSL